MVDVVIHPKSDVASTKRCLCLYKCAVNKPDWKQTFLWNQLRCPTTSHQIRNLLFIFKGALICKQKHIPTTRKQNKDTIMTTMTDPLQNSTLEARVRCRKLSNLYSIRFTLFYIAVTILNAVHINALLHSNFVTLSRQRQFELQAVSAKPKEFDARTSKRVRFLNKMGFKRVSKDIAEIRKVEESEARTASGKYKIQSVEALEEYFDDQSKMLQNDKGEVNYDARVKALCVEGDTQIIGSPEHVDYVHPVAKLIHERKRNGSKCVEGEREDGFKVALVVEGGGMRGCVSAGMVCAIHHLGLRDTVDVVYGSSAGSIIGAYFITGQLPWFGPEVYYDKLTTAGREFIDTGRLLRSIGFGLVDPRLYKDVLTRPNNGKPVLNLSFLLRKTMQETKPLNWEIFKERQSVQPLRVVASALKSEKPFIMDMEHGHFQTLNELSNCMHASCLLPGIAGPLMNIKVKGDNDKPKFVLRNNLKDPDYEPLADALIYAPMPYDSAQESGATHVIVIRSRPDGTDVTGKGGVFERLIFRRFFMRKNKLVGTFQRMTQHLHKKLYARNVIELNDAAYSEADYRDTSKSHILTLALPPGSEEVTRLETGREAIFEGVRRGFARAYDALVEDPAERGRGQIVARQYFPDEILDYNPTDLEIDDALSAFEMYMHDKGLYPRSWDNSFVPGGSSS